MTKKYLEAAKEHFIQDFREGVYSEKKQEIWFENELERNSTMLSSLMQFFSKIGYTLIGIVIGVVGGSIVGQSTVLLKQETILFFPLTIISVFVLVVTIILVYYTNKQKESLDEERLKILEADSQIRKYLKNTKRPNKKKGD